MNAADLTQLAYLAIDAAVAAERAAAHVTTVRLADRPLDDVLAAQAVADQAWNHARGLERDLVAAIREALA